MNTAFKTILAASLTAISLATPVLGQIALPAAESTWVCSAQNMLSGSYKGGDYAYIQLAGYSFGGSYKIVEKSDSTAKGVTKDGTPFECKKNP